MPLRDKTLSSTSTITSYPFTMMGLCIILCLTQSMKRFLYTEMVKFAKKQK